MIYQHTNKRTAMLSLATSHIAHLCNQLNHVALPNFMPRFKSIIFYQNSSKVQVKCKIFERWGLRPQTLKPELPLRISGYAPVYFFFLTFTRLFLQLSLTNSLALISTVLTLPRTEPLKERSSLELQRPAMTGTRDCNLCMPLLFLASSILRNLD